MSSYNWPPVVSGSTAGVSSFNSLTGDVTISAGANITLTPSGNNIAIAATAGGVSSVGTYDSQAPVANGAVIVGAAIDFQSADATHPGMVNTTTQSFAGDKTFTGAIAASNFSGTSSGTNTGDQTITLTGDITGSGTGSFATTLATVNSNVGSFGDATHVSAITVSAKGLVTAAASTSIQIAESQVTGLVSDLAGKQDGPLTGDVTTSGAAATLATVNSNVGSFGSSTSIPSLTVNAKGLVTAASGNVVIAPAGTLTGATLAANVLASSLTSVGTIATGVWNGTTIALANGGTGQTSKSAAFDALSPMSASGDIIYGGASGTGTKLSKGSDGQVLTLASGLPSWAAAAAAIPAVTSKSTTYLATTADNIIFVSASASWTLSLYTAVGNTGRTLTITRTDNDLSHTVTIDPNGSETIQGSTTRTINTQYESVTIVSDGANWQVTDHKCDTEWASYTVTLQGTGSNPTVGTNTATAYWRRVGDSIECVYSLDQTGAGSSGSGTYLLNLPSGVSLDLTKSAAGNGGDGHGGTIIGICWLGNTQSASASTVLPGNMFIWDQTRIYPILAGGSATQASNWGSTNFALGNATINFSSRAVAPVSTWWT